jgi:hypothetical protein
MTAVRAALAALGVAALPACDTIGNPLEVIGQKPPAPDEFQVLAREELRMPPSMRELPEPRPGTPSPREPDARAEAQAALGIAQATGAARAARPSPGEAELLAAAEAGEAEPDIRDTLAAESGAPGDGPYEPPMIWEVFGLDGGEGPYGDVDPESVLDPVAESQRLQREGIRAPNDPEAAPAAEEEDGGSRLRVGTSDALDYPPTGTRAPRNTLANTAPGRPSRAVSGAEEETDGEGG